MRIVKFKNIPRKHRDLLLLTKKVADRSISPRGSKVGCIIVCSDGSKYLGATVSRTKVIGSTCAERMALDQWYFSNSRSTPETCYLVGTFNRKNWKKNQFVLPVVFV